VCLADHRDLSPDRVRRGRLIIVPTNPNARTLLAVHVWMMRIVGGVNHPTIVSSAMQRNHSMVIVIRRRTTTLHALAPLPNPLTITSRFRPIPLVAMSVAWRANTFVTMEHLLYPTQLCFSTRLHPDLLSHRLNWVFMAFGLPLQRITKCTSI